MKHCRPLGIRKFDSILLASSLEMIVGILLSLTDTAVMGHIVGLSGLSAMNVIAPVLGFTVFTENLFSVGTSMLYARRTGEYRQREAEEIFGMGLMMACGMGLLTYVALALLMPLYLDSMGVQGQIRSHVTIYMSWLKFELMLSPVYELINLLITTDGDEYLSMASNIARPLLNILLSIVLGRRWGITGIGMGTLISTLIALAILGLHFFSKRSTLHPRRHFDRKDLGQMLLFGWNDSAMFFILPVLFYAVTRMVIARYGEFYLPLLTILYTVIEVTGVFESTGEAMRPILPIYLGDKNRRSVMQLTIHAHRINLIYGFLFAGVLLVAADWIPLAFDITDPRLLPLCAAGLRIYALACPMLSELALANSYYLNTGKEKIAFFEMLLVQLLCPLVLAVPLTLTLDLHGLFIGFAAAPYLAALILFAVIRAGLGRAGFPWYLEDDGAALLSETLTLNANEVVAFVARAEAFMKENRVPDRVANRVEVACEDLLLLIRDKNPGEKVAAECCVRVEHGGVTLSMWDSGVIFDITDQDQAAESFRSYFVASMMAQSTARRLQKRHMVATSFNRNTFFFPMEASR